jgi:hypothetical protein
MSTGYPDCCRACIRASGGQLSPMVWPRTTRHTGRRLVSDYRCHRCNHKWTRGYAVDSPAYV